MPVFSSARDHEKHYANIQATIGTTELVAAPGAGKRIVVIGYCMGAHTANCTCDFKSATTEIASNIVLVKGYVFASAYSEFGVMQCAVNEALNITVTATGAGGHLTYVIVEDV